MRPVPRAPRSASTALSPRPAAHRAIRAASSAIAALALTLLLSSCEFFGLDMFPPELQNLEASYDLRSALATQGVSIKDILKIEGLRSSSGKEFVFVLLNDGISRKLAVVETELSSLLAFRSDPFITSLMMADASSNLVCGQLRFATNTEVFSQTFNDLDLVYENRFGFWDSEYSLARVIFMPSSYPPRLEVKSFATDFIVAGSSSGAHDIFSIAPPESFELVDVLYTGATKPVYLLFLVSGLGNKPFIMEFANPSAFATAILSTPVEVGASSAKLFDINVKDRAIWLTTDGLIAKNSDKETRLVRYDYASGKEIDSKYLDSEWESALSFEPEGDYWYYYNRRTGMLNKLRSWWK